MLNTDRPYRIEVVGGTERGKLCLSCNADGYVDLWSGDDQSGRQQWMVQTVTSGKYQLHICGGTKSHAKMLSCTPGGKVDLWHTDDRSGRQQWYMSQVKPGIYNIQVGGGTESGKSLLSCTPRGEVDLFCRDDGSGRQQWRLVQLGDPNREGIVTSGYPHPAGRGRIPRECMCSEVQDMAFMSKMMYASPDERRNVGDWEVDPAFNFREYALFRKGHEITIAFKGTHLSSGRDVAADIDIALGCGEGATAGTVIFYNQIMERRERLGLKGNVYITGHSLGGYRAYYAAVYHKLTFNHIPMYGSIFNPAASPVEWVTKWPEYYVGEIQAHRIIDDVLSNTWKPSRTRIFKHESVLSDKHTLDNFL